MFRPTACTGVLVSLPQTINIQGKIMNEEKQDKPATPRILLVDDEERFRNILKIRLTARGKDVAEAADGFEALEMIKAEPRDIVVLDVKMPGMNGLETLKEIKKIAPETEVILLTGHASIDTAIDGVELGAFDYLHKPCSIEDLMDKIQSAFEAKTARAKRDNTL